MPIDNSSRFPKPLAADLLELSEGMAIVIDGDTAPKAITAGQYLFIKNHSTLATGGYHATAAIASGASITSSNVAADTDGIVNGAVSALNGNLATETITTGLTALTVSKFGKLMIANAQGVLPANFQNGIVWNVPVAYRPATAHRSVVRDGASGATARLVVDHATGNLSILGNTVNDYFYGQICWIIGA